MKYFAIDINRKFTDKVNNYINQGFIFNSVTMAGSQGEIAKADLLSPDKKFVYRIRLEQFSQFKLHHEEGIALKIEKFDVSNNSRCYNSFDIMTTLWNDKGEEVESELFYTIGRYNCIYGDKLDYEEYIRKQSERFCNYINRNSIKVFDESAKIMVLPWVKKQPKCKSCTVKHIDEVRKEVEYFYNKTVVKYIVVVKGESKTMYEFMCYI